MIRKNRLIWKRQRTQVLGDSMSDLFIRYRVWELGNQEYILGRSAIIIQPALFGLDVRYPAVIFIAVSS